MKKFHKQLNKEYAKNEATEYGKCITELLNSTKLFAMLKSNKLIEHKPTGKTNQKAQNG